MRGATETAMNHRQRYGRALEDRADVAYGKYRERAGLAHLGDTPRVWRTWVVVFRAVVGRLRRGEGTRWEGLLWLGLNLFEALHQQDVRASVPIQCQYASPFARPRMDRNACAEEYEKSADFRICERRQWRRTSKGRESWVRLRWLGKDPER